MRSDYLTTYTASAARRAAIHLCLGVTAVVAAACGGDGDGGPTDPGTRGDPTLAATVRATPAIQFTPSTIELIAGGTVTFEFGSVEHDVFFDNAPPGAPENITAPSANKSVARTFQTAGQYRYNCHIHPGMAGTINVR